MIYNNAVGVPNPDGWELTTDSSGEVTWKAYEEIIMNPDILPTLEEWRLICKMIKKWKK